MNAMLPELIAIVDESAEKLLPRSWVKMTCLSNATPSANDIYTVQAISGDDNSVWIHTHGLNRCHTTEVEILNSSRELYNVHFNLLSTYASYLLDNTNEEPRYNLAHIGFFKSEEPIVATCISWCDALNEYENLTLGGINEREDAHNSKSSVIFLYKNHYIYLPFLPSLHILLHTCLQDIKHHKQRRLGLLSLYLQLCGLCDH